MIKTEEKYTLRKSKKYKNLVSVGLGLATAVAIGMATDNEAFASDVDKTENPATNSVTKQPESTPEANNSQGKVNQSQGSVEVNLKSPELEKAVEQAVNGGVKVEKSEVVDKGTVKTTEELSKVTKEVQEEYKKKAEEINKKTEVYVKDKEEHKQESQRIIEENKEKKEKYEKDLSDYNKKVEEIKSENEKIKVRNEEKQRDYNKKLLEYEKLKEEQKRKLEELKKNSGKDGYLSNSQLQSLVYQNEPEAKLTIDSGDNTKVTKEDKIPLTNVYSASGYYIEYNDYKPIYLTYTNLKNSTYGNTKISKVVYKIQRKTKGKNNMLLSVFNDPTTGVGFRSKDPRQELSVEITFYDENGNQIRFTKENPALLALSSITTNAMPDGSFYREVIKDYNFSFVKITGSSVTEQADGIYSIKDNKFKGQGAKYEHTETDFEGSPLYWYLGAAGRLDNADSIKMTFFSDVATHSQFWMSINSRVASPVAVYNQPPKVPILEELKTEPPKPEEPVYKEVPKAPEVPTVKYNTYKVNVVPSIEKQVKNVENQDINNQYVSKLSTVKWELRTKELPAGRKEIDKYVIKDSLPKGYVLDVEKTKEESKDYDVSYNKDNHTVTLTATAKLLEQLNKDLTKSILAPIPTLVGTVTNDGATYKNNFSLTINNDYEVYSNIVKVSTPGKPNDEDNPNNNLIKPEKHNYNKDGVLIDGKQVERGSVNYYKLLWDLDQYNGIKATQEDIKKGFYYVYDYPEEALELLEKGVKIVDFNNNEVKGITVKSYASLEKSPKEVQEMLKKAGITPKGAYQLFTVDNPEEFFEKYVVKGNSIYITSPMKVKEDFNSNGGKYENKAYQIDFGNGYESEVVVNNVPKKEQPPKPEQPKEKEKPKEKTLPKTSAVKENSQGYDNMLGYILMTLLTFVLGFFGIKRKVK